MDDLFDDPPDTLGKPPPPPPPLPTASLLVDPKLLTKALKKMQGLVRGNGMSPEEVSLGTEEGDVNVTMYRFRARTFLKLVPEYGVKTEPGRNTKAELMPTQAEFNRALAQAIMDARTIPEKRKQIVDFMFARTDKGFGIKEQRIRFHHLNRDFVQHEKCITCKNIGRTACGKCHGHGVMNCANCQGRRQVVCPRCRGTAKIHTNKGTIPCQLCRADGKVNCPKCAGRGQIKCRTCAAVGSLQCRPCAGTGWLSHLAHIETYAQIYFDFEREILPPPLIALIEQNPARLVERNDIEVALKEGWTPEEKIARGETQEKKKDTDGEPDDMIWLDYDAICPYGPIAFKLKERVVAANLFGFQARLNDCPPFLDEMTKIGQQALIDAATGRGDVIGKVQRAAKFALLQDIITQTLRLKNPLKTQQLMVTKYTAGMKPEHFAQLINAADFSIRHITRKWRSIGLVLGLVGFSGISGYYFMLGGRSLLQPHSLPEIILWPVDVLLLPLGMIMGTFCSKFMALWSQNRALKNIVPDEILGRTLPKAGKTMWWALGLSAAIIAISLITAATQQFPIPGWLGYILNTLN